MESVSSAEAAQGSARNKTDAMASFDIFLILNIDRVLCSSMSMGVNSEIFVVLTLPFVLFEMEIHLCRNLMPLHCHLHCILVVDIGIVSRCRQTMLQP